jgi:hypothetical protein
MLPGEYEPNSGGASRTWELLAAARGNAAGGFSSSVEDRGRGSRAFE